MFSELVLEHFRNPHNAGDMPGATATVNVTNPVCGDVLRLSVRVEAGRIIEVRFKTQGCVASIAASSMLTDLLAGKALDALSSIRAQTEERWLGLITIMPHAMECQRHLTGLQRKGEENLVAMACLRASCFSRRQNLCPSRLRIL